MAGKVIVIVPTQGLDTQRFLANARELNRRVYHNKATIVRTTLSGNADEASVSFRTLNGHHFAWETTHDVESVITISHGAICDGPNLGYLMPPGQKNQPWDSAVRYNRDGSKSNMCSNTLSEPAKAFWGKVSRSMTSKGKIILLGCEMGSGAYAGNVAAVVGKRVFASKGPFAAADEGSVLRHVTAIEHGKVKGPMKQSSPPTRHRRQCDPSVARGRF